MTVVKEKQTKSLADIMQNALEENEAKSRSSYQLSAPKVRQGKRACANTTKLGEKFVYCYKQPS